MRRERTETIIGNREQDTMSRTPVVLVHGSRRVSGTSTRGSGRAPCAGRSDRFEETGQ